MLNDINIPEDQFNEMVIKKLLELKAENDTLKICFKHFASGVIGLDEREYKTLYNQLYAASYQQAVKDFWVSKGGFDDEINPAIQDLLDGL